MWAGSREYKALGRMRDEWYPDDIKRVPEDLSWLDDFAVAKWYMDDGHRQQFAAQADRIRFATHSFTESDVRRLGDRLGEMYGVSYHLVRDRGFSLIINSGRRQQIRTVWAAIAPHMHPSLRYKLPEDFRDAPYVEMTPGREIVQASEVKVLSVATVAPTERNFPAGRVGFDITTTTNNYLARGVLVHNSLGILHRAGKEWAVATRGSFAGEQAQHATALYAERYAHAWEPLPGWTYLLEIIYPANRIVLNYGQDDDLILLGAVQISTGMPVGPQDDVCAGWPGPRTEVYAYASLAEALAAEPRENAEGLVVRYLPGGESAGTMVKLKQADYVALHRIVTGLTGRRLWERAAVHAAMAADPDTSVRRLGQVLHLDQADVQGILDVGPDWLEQVRQSVPEEFLDWIAETTTAQAAEVAAILSEVEATVEAVKGLERREIAARIAGHPHRGIVFAALDGKTTLMSAWAAIRPAADRAFGARGEDVA